MKTSVLLIVWLLAVCSVRADTFPYRVIFKEHEVATQAVEIVRSGDLTTVRTSYATDLYVFIARHHYAEDYSAAFRADGTVERFSARRSEGPVQVEILGQLEADDALRVVRSDPEGVSTNLILRKDYDVNSLALYSTAPADFLPTNQIVRVLEVSEGRVVPMTVQTISESYTFERQNLKSTHVIWGEGEFASHSWHPERFSNLPSRYIRHDSNGEFIFELQRK